MKRIFLLFIAVFTFTFSNSQNVSFGVKGGLNSADLSFSENDNETSKFKARTSFHIGAIADIHVSDNISIQPELLYSSKGSSLKDSEGEVDYKFQIIENYITLPVMLKYFATEDLSIELGPEIGFLLSAKTKVDISGSDSDNSSEEDAKDEFETTDIGLGFGLGYKMESGLFFNARYVLGLTNIADEIPNDEYIKNNVIQVSLGYRFN